MRKFVFAAALLLSCSAVAQIAPVRTAGAGGTSQQMQVNISGVLTGTANLWWDPVAKTLCFTTPDGTQSGPFCLQNMGSSSGEQEGPGGFLILTGNSTGVLAKNASIANDSAPYLHQDQTATMLLDEFGQYGRNLWIWPPLKTPSGATNTNNTLLLPARYEKLLWDSTTPFPQHAWYTTLDSYGDLAAATGGGVGILQRWFNSSTSGTLEAILYATGTLITNGFVAAGGGIGPYATVPAAITGAGSALTESYFYTSTNGMAPLVTFASHNTNYYGVMGVVSADGTAPDDLFGVGYAPVQNSTFTPVLTWSGAGNVGIGLGTTLPSAALHVNGTIKQKVYTVSTLPAAGTIGAGARAFVSDSTVAASGNFGAVVAGSGTNAVPVYSDGTNWRIG